MDSYIHSTVTVFQQDLIGKCEVYNTLRDMIDIVESYNLETKYSHAQKKFQLAEQLNDVLISRIKYLEEENQRRERELQQIRTFGKTVREKFLNDILFFLSENRTNQRLKERIVELESLIPEGGIDLNSATAPAAVTDDAKANQDTPAVNNEPVDGQEATSTVVTKSTKRNPIYPPIVLDLEDPVLLTMFAFLTTGEVLEFAQICRYVYQRVDKIFGINYPLIKPEWTIRENVIVATSPELAGTHRSPVPTSEPTGGSVIATSSVLSPQKELSPSNAAGGESAANADFRVTRELIEPITKKLTVQEIKVIVGLAEKVKKFQLQIESLNAEKEDLVEEKERINSQLFFFMNKLQECETVLLEFMQKERTLRQQAASDNEVISYLDLQVQQLEGELHDARQRSSALQASLDLQMGTHSVKEEQLQAELSEYKYKFEQLDAKFKTEKKILAREVKTLRAKVETLTVEKTQMSTKLTALRQALSLDN